MNAPRQDLERAVLGALKSAIKDHGPITADKVTSAAKRVIGNLPNAGGEQLLAEVATLLREILDDSKSETEHGGRSTVDEAAVTAMLEKLGRPPK